MLKSGSLALSGILVLIACTAIAHSPTEAYFEIYQTPTGIIVDAEFPWTLRNALIDHSPELIQATSQEQFQAVFEQYIQEHFILRDQRSEIIELYSIEKRSNNDHSHSANYRLLFAQSEIAEVTNTVMIALNPSQNNFQTMITGDSEIEFFTNNLAPIYLLKNKKTNGLIWSFSVLLFIPLAILLKKILF